MRDDERRQFHRVIFNSDAVILRDGVRESVHLLDISLKGALTTRPKKPPVLDERLSLKIPLNTCDSIDMEVIVAHVDTESVGFTCVSIDLDSITHVKRLLELNLCDPEMLRRDIHALIQA